MLGKFLIIWVKIGLSFSFTCSQQEPCLLDLSLIEESIIKYK